MCCCCGANPNQTHIPLTVNSIILLIFSIITASLMVSTTDDYKYVKAYIEANENNQDNSNTYYSGSANSGSAYSGYTGYTGYTGSAYDDGNSLTLEITDNDSLKFENWFKNLKSYEMGIIVTRLIVFIIICIILILACVLECNNKLPANGIFYALFIAFYIFQIVFHIIFAILSIVLGTAELLSIAQYALLLPSGAKISGPILKRGATQIAFSLFFFVYQLVFICLIVCIFLECLEK